MDKRLVYNKSTRTFSDDPIRYVAESFDGRDHKLIKRSQLNDYPGYRIYEFDTYKEAREYRRLCNELSRCSHGSWESQLMAELSKFNPKILKR